MRTRTALAASLTAVVALGALSPAVAAPAKPKPKPKPIVMTYDATATPDATTTLPEPVERSCDPVTPTARHRTAFKVPAAGTLKVELDNTLDWAVAVRQGGKLLASADGETPEVKETVVVKLRKAGTVDLDACNFAGEPVVPVKVTFTFA